ncbi:hypothetical protein FPQ18DRAFT_366119 [Pyronema domesticum]|nr:hypothetical protein FPQ18DRAFT_366119 [Pyronema domesticum]
MAVVTLSVLPDSLTTPEKRDYISAVQCLQSQPSNLTSLLPGSISRFEEFLGTHIVSTNSVHFVGHFQPWHQYLVATYERELRQKCGYKGAQPYWDWTLDVTTNSSIFSAPVLDPDTGFGGNGPYVNNAFTPRLAIPGRTGGGCITSGPFANLTLHLGPGTNVENNPHCLTRDISPLVTNKALSFAAVNATLDAADFCSFDIAHGGVHLGIGGELGTIADVYSSPGDPLFYLHHAQMDRLWWKWQQMDPERRLKDIAGPDTGSRIRLISKGTGRLQECHDGF